MERDVVKLDDESRKHALERIKRYFDEERDEDIGELAAGMLLEFFLRSIGPFVYNQGLDDAQAWFERRLQDLEVDYRALRMSVRR